VAKPADTLASADTLALVALNLGGPDSPDAVEPFLRNLFADPDVIQLGPLLRPVQPLIAHVIARRRAPLSRAAYAQIGGSSPILAESTDRTLAALLLTATVAVVASVSRINPLWILLVGGLLGFAGIV